MIIDLRDIRLADLDRVGGKAANLGELISAGLPVPGGFCVPAAVYRNSVAGAWQAVEAALAADDPETARELVEAVEFPAGLAEAVAAGLADLGDGPVAVRSSATAEDLAEASFAGQQETYLGVVGADAVLAAVRRCWGSLWAPRSIAYRERDGFDHGKVDLAVVVQAMIAAEVAGVAFTADPVTGRAGEIAIDASWGLGESVVSGAVTPDAFQVRDGRVVGRTLGAKQTRIELLASGQTEQRETSAADGDRYCLTEEQVLAVAELAQRVRAHYGREMDVEWALAAGQVWLLQARPITTPVSAVPDGPDGRARASRLSRWLHDDILEHFPAPYPLDVAVVELGARQLLGAFELAGVRVLAPGGLITLDADGVARVAHPKVRAWGVPGGIARLMRAKPVDPRTWDSGPGRVVDKAIAELVAVDLAGLPDAGLTDRFTAIWAAAERMLVARFQEYLPYQIVWGAQLDALLRLAGRRELSQYDLLTDLDFATVVIDRGLRGLAASASTRPAVREALGARPIDVAAVRAADPEWWGMVEGFLAAHGARTTGLYVPFANLSWREDLPGFLATIAALLRAEPAVAGAEGHAELVAGVEARLPRWLRRRFRWLVDSYRAGHVVREHSVTQMEELALLARATVREAEARMVAAGALAGVGDAKFLTRDELFGWLNGESSVDLLAVVRRRKQARPRAEAVWWGASDAGSVAGSDEAGVLLTGAAGSPGRVGGPVRVVTSPEQFPDLAPGDVLVCRFTDPSWTPLFALAAAVVADTGGRLSHAAIVAREYGIPAVLGVGTATTALRDGQQVTVDGSRGLVLDAD